LTSISAGECPSEQDAVTVCREIIEECRPRFVCHPGWALWLDTPGSDQSDNGGRGFTTRRFPKSGPQPCRFFYFRDPGVTQAMPEAWPGGVFREPEGSPAELKLRQLKEACCPAGYEPGHLRGPPRGIPPASSDGVGAIGRRVYKDLLASIDEEPGAEPSNAPRVRRGELANGGLRCRKGWALCPPAAARSCWTSSRRFATGRRAGTSRSSGAGRLREDGAPGQFSAGCTRPNHDGTRVVSHFAGATPRSSTLRSCLRRLCYELAGDGLALLRTSMRDGAPARTIEKGGGPVTGGSW